MHYHVEVAVEAESPTEAIEKAETLLEPFNERDGENSDGKWDWYQIGGRWRGVHVAGETISDDIPKTLCKLCFGSGRRPDADKLEQENPGWLKWSGGCNGCKGEGYETPWPTQWPIHPSDAIPAKDVYPGLAVHALITEKDGWISGPPDEEYPSLDTDLGKLPELGNGFWLVTVDIHS